MRKVKIFAHLQRSNKCYEFLSLPPSPSLSLLLSVFFTFAVVVVVVAVPRRHLMRIRDIGSHSTVPATPFCFLLAFTFLLPSALLSLASCLVCHKWFNTWQLAALAPLPLPPHPTPLRISLLCPDPYVAEHLLIYTQSRWWLRRVIKRKL